jgi:hypothetical protein
MSDQPTDALAISEAIEALPALLAEYADNAARLYENSVQENAAGICALAQVEGEKKLVAVVSRKGDQDDHAPFAPEATLKHEVGTVLVCPLTPANAQALRALPVDRPSAAGHRRGARLRRPPGAGHAGSPARHSYRQRATGSRTAVDPRDGAHRALAAGRLRRRDVAVFQDGFEDGFGADADHLM